MWKWFSRVFYRKSKMVTNGSSEVRTFGKANEMETEMDKDVS